VVSKTVAPSSATRPPTSSHSWLAGGRCQLEGFQQLVGAAAGRARAQAEQPAEHRQVLPPRQQLVHGGVLAGQAEQAADLLRLADHVVAPDPGVAGVGSQ
jgi:acyl-coenzyme A thioesterase PaaI-like protein